MRKAFDTRRFTIVAAFLGLVLFFALPVSAQNEVVLTIWVGDGEYRMQEYRVVADLFEKQNPGVKVELIAQSGSQAQVMEKILLAIISGAPPDLMWLEGSGVIEFAHQGLLADLTDTLAGLNFVPADTQEMTYDGRIWAVPYHTTSRGLFKNVDYFHEVGMDPNVDPADMEELYQWNLRFIRTNEDGTYTRVGMVPWQTNWHMPGWIWAFGGELLEIDGTTYRPTANAPKNVEAMEWIRSWAQLYNNRTPIAGGATGFQVGNVAMSAESTSVVSRFKDAGIRFTVGRVPHPEGGRNGVWGGGTAVGVPVNAPNMEWALKMARFFGEADVQIARFEGAPHGLPANWDALREVVAYLPVEFAGLIEQLPEARPRTPLWIEYYVNQLRPVTEMVVLGDLTPQEALDRVQLVMEARYADVFGR